jgi:formylmethanofuran dehydrogenase subunit A
MPELLIRNGCVFDPLNGIEGEKLDISVKDGRVVEKVGRKARVLDASGMTVMPGGVDIHSHIAGSKANCARMMRPEDHSRDPELKTKHTRSGVGHTIPSVFTTGYRYARMGYTTVFEPATPPLKTRHTHEELNDIPIIDKGCFPLFGNNWFVMEYVKQGRIEELAAYVAWMLEATKGYAIKIVNPGGIEAWRWGRNLRRLDDTVPNFDVTPREIVQALCRVNSLLNLPHAVHVHPNGLSEPGNYQTTIDTMDCVSHIPVTGHPIMHVTHVQFTGRKGWSWADVRSGAPEIANYVNTHDHVSIDPGQLIFTNVTWMTADGPAMFALFKLTKTKWFNADVESETGAGVVSATYKKSNYVNAIQWGIALELALLVKNPWKIFLTTDHPNGGPFTAYPRVISWLVSKEARKKLLDKINKTASRRLDLPGIDREYTLHEIATITRAATAKSLGLKSKGHLGMGADADIAVYNIDPSEVDLSRDYKLVRKVFARAASTIKGGHVVVKNGEVVRSVQGRTFWTKPVVSEGVMKAVTSDLETKFDDYYTVRMANYPIHEQYLTSSEMITTKAGV